MVEIIEKNRCTGCGSCFNSCTHNAISVQFDKEGFEYPIIDQNLCIDCGLCKLSCPVLQYNNRQKFRDEISTIQKGFVARNTNYNQRLISSSGSIFPIIAEWILSNGGIVVGTGYDSKFNAIHKIIFSKEEIIRLQGSKYLQCKTDNETFKTIKKYLNTGKIVLYTGMACQVEGLKSFLKKDYPNLYTIDLICMGIPSPVVWQIYLDTFFNKEKIKAINFKEKSIGWNQFCFKIDTNKRSFKEIGMKNMYLQSMFRSWNMRPSCFQCPFKKEKRISDYTIADAWGTSKLAKDFDDNKGLSSVIVHSEKGYNLWKSLGNSVLFIEVSIDEIAAGNTNLIENKRPSGDRTLFYQLLEKKPKKAFTKLCSIKEPSYIHFCLSKIWHKLFS